MVLEPQCLNVESYFVQGWATNCRGGVRKSCVCFSFFYSGVVGGGVVGPLKKDYRTLESILGCPCVGKVPRIGAQGNTAYGGNLPSRNLGAQKYDISYMTVFWVASPSKL